MGIICFFNYHYWLYPFYSTENFNWYLFHRVSLLQTKKKQKEAYFVMCMPALKINYRLNINSTLKNLPICPRLHSVFWHLFRSIQINFQLKITRWNSFFLGIDFESAYNLWWNWFWSNYSGFFHSNQKGMWFEIFLWKDLFLGRRLT